MINLSIPGQMTRGELEAIEKLARKAPVGGTVVETGSLFGRSSYTWATSVDPSVKVYCIDPWVREKWIIELVEEKVKDCPIFSFNAFKRYTAECTNMIPLRGYSPQDFEDWKKPVDIFFDDSLHHNPFFRTNLRFWYRHMRPGGVMCGHDYCDEWPDVRSEVNRLAQELAVPINTAEWFWWIQLPDKPTGIRSFVRRWL